MDMLTVLLLLLLGIVAILVLIFVILGVFKRQQYPTKPEYTRTLYVLSPAELNFFTVLLTSVGNDHYVFAKIRLADLVKVNNLVVEGRDWWKKFGPIAQKHVDFVVCSRRPVTPLIVFELDNSSHQTARAKARDSLVDRVLGSAGLPIVHIPYSTQGYSRAQLQQHIATALTQLTTPTRDQKKEPQTADQRRFAVNGQA